MRSIMPFTVFVLAVAFAFASVNDKSSQAPLEFIQLNNPESCTEVTANCGDGEELCKFSTQQVYGESNGTKCNIQLMQDKRVGK